MTRNTMIALAAGGSAALLAGAFVYQLLGYAPCPMCLWQRWPHAAAIIIGILAVAIPGRFMPALGAIAAAATGAIGVYHTGVERDWWEGPASCSGGNGLDGLSGADLLAVEGPAIVMCDQVAWEFLSLSKASWSALVSFAMMAVWVTALRLSAGSKATGSSRTV